MRRHKHFARDDVLAPGAREPADKPVVDDLDIADRQQKEGALERRLGVRSLNEGAELDPARGVAAAGEGPGAAQHVPAFGWHGGAGGRETGAGERVLVGTP